jgi:coenzyme F420 biosynthesis associated uncharacterized protein
VTDLIDPRIARVVARRFAGASDVQRSYLMERLQRDLDWAVPSSEELVADASGIASSEPVRWRIIDRPQWADANISGMARLLSPLGRKVAKRLDNLPLPLRIAQRSALSAEVGMLLGYVSRRVLGQYDLLVTEAGDDVAPHPSPRSSSSDGANLYFVGPNIVETERRFSFVPRDFALWVSLHEVTHRYQFVGVPWLADRFFALVDDYLSNMDVDARALARRIGAAAQRLLSGSVPPEERNPMYLLASDDQKRSLDDLQALMAVVEGHGNYVMDTVGSRTIPSFRRMRRVFQRRRQQATAMQRIINNAIGLEMKLRQYELGQAFCEEVVSAGGQEALSNLWEGPDAFPTLGELREPRRWLKRVA